MSRNIFSNIFSLKSLKLFLLTVIFIVFGLVSINTNKVDAKIYIETTGGSSVSNPVYLADSDGKYYLYKYLLSNVEIKGQDLETLKNGINTILTKWQGDLEKEYKSITLDYKKQLDDLEIDKTKVENQNAISYLKNLIDKSSVYISSDFVKQFENLKKLETEFYENILVFGDVTVSQDIETIYRIQRRVFLYKSFKDFIDGKSSIDISKIDKVIIDKATTLAEGFKKGGRLNAGAAEQQLEENEINPVDINGKPTSDYGAAIMRKVSFPFTVTFDNPPGGGGGGGPVPKDNTDPAKITESESTCAPGASLSDIMGLSTGSWFSNKYEGCSVPAYLINSILQGIAGIFGVVLGWVGALFDWIFDMSITDFNDWIENSGAVNIYKNIILAFVTSLLLPLVFYLVIRMLIDKDSANIEKLLPKILITALFVYFSFGIAGWLVDQSNIITIYTYRSIHGGGETTQNLGDIMTNALGLSAGKNSDVQNNIGKSLGSWSTIPYTFGQLIINFVGLFIVFQAMILIFARSVVLLLCLIFSPIMVLPDGLPGAIGDFITEWRKKVLTYFTNNLLLAPVFMFLMMIAIKIGGLSNDLIKTTTELDNATPGNAGFLSGILTTILVVVVMQLAITVAKNLSGDLGKTISGHVSSFLGGVASGAGGVLKGRMRGAMQNSKMMNKDEGWMKQGGAAHKRMTTLLNGKMSNEDYHNSLSDKGKEKHIDNLKKNGQTIEAIKLEKAAQKEKRQNEFYGNIKNLSTGAAGTNSSNQTPKAINPGSIRSNTANNSAFRNSLAGNQRGTAKFQAASIGEKKEMIKAAQAKQEKKDVIQKNPNKPISEVRQKMGELDKQGIEISKDFKNTSFANRRAGVELVKGEINKVSSENKLRDTFKNSTNQKNKNMVNRLRNRGGGGNSNAPELSNSTVSSNPPKLTLDRGSGNKQEIPLSKKDDSINVKEGYDSGTLQSTKIRDDYKKSVGGRELTASEENNLEGQQRKAMEERWKQGKMDAREE